MRREFCRRVQVLTRQPPTRRALGRGGRVAAISDEALGKLLPIGETMEVRRLGLKLLLKYFDAFTQREKFRR